ncbi:MAG: hypothetical protein SFU99_16800 [Saprospiraceae bacterium]|nr:hypothetical protein [Saprospiraceae bacterium]
MDLPFDLDKLPTPEEIEEMIEAMEGLKFYLKETRQQIIEDKVNLDGGMTPEFAASKQAEQTAWVKELVRMQAELKSLGETLEDVQFAIDTYRFEQAKIVHEALREASKTDPSLKEAVAEMDALYEDAMREQAEEDAGA